MSDGEKLALSCSSSLFKLFSQAELPDCERIPGILQLPKRVFNPGSKRVNSHGCRGVTTPRRHQPHEITIESHGCRFRPSSAKDTEHGAYEEPDIVIFRRPNTRPNSHDRIILQPLHIESEHTQLRQHASISPDYQAYDGKPCLSIQRNSAEKHGEHGLKCNAYSRNRVKALSGATTLQSLTAHNNRSQVTRKEQLLHSEHDIVAIGQIAEGLHISPGSLPVVTSYLYLQLGPETQDESHIDWPSVDKAPIIPELNPLLCREDSDTNWFHVNPAYQMTLPAPETQGGDSAHMAEINPAWKDLQMDSSIFSAEYLAGQRPALVGIDDRDIEPQNMNLWREEKVLWILNQIAACGSFMTWDTQEQSFDISVSLEAKERQSHGRQPQRSTDIFRLETEDGRALHRSPYSVRSMWLESWHSPKCWRTKENSSGFCQVPSPSVKGLQAVMRTFKSFRSFRLHPLFAAFNLFDVSSAAPVGQTGSFGLSDLSKIGWWSLVYIPPAIAIATAAMCLSRQMGGRRVYESLSLVTSILITIVSQEEVAVPALSLT